MLYLGNDDRKCCVKYNKVPSLSRTQPPSAVLRILDRALPLLYRAVKADQDQPILISANYHGEHLDGVMVFSRFE